MLIDLDVMRPIASTHQATASRAGVGPYECLICALEKRYYRFTRKINYEEHFKKHSIGKKFSNKNNSEIVSGDFYNGDWYIPGLYFCGSLDKIFKFTNGEFIEWTDKLDTKMIKSYADVVVKDRNGFPLYLPRNYHVDMVNIAANNPNFSLDFESLCA